MEVKDSAKKNNSLLPLSCYLPLVVIAVFAVFFNETITGLYIRWVKWDEGLSHGLLVIGVFLVLLTKSLPWSAHKQSKLIFVALLLATAACSMAWFLFYILRISILEQLILLPLLALTCAAIFGIRTAVQHRLLLLMPIFAIPIWDQLTNLLVNLSASIVGEMVRLIKMPAIIDGNSIYIPYGHILIADGCSGLRYLVIALAIGYIIGYLNRYSEKKMLAVLAVAGLLGLIANWIRIFVLILVGYQTQMQSSLMSDHEYFGWAVFGLLMLPAIYFAPVVRAQSPLSVDQSPVKPAYILPFFVLAIGPLCALLLNPQPKVSPSTDFLPTTLTPSTALRMPVAVSSPPNSYRENAYTLMSDTQVFVQVDQYQRQSQDEKLVPYIVHLFDSDLWSSETMATNTPGKLIILREKNGLRRVVQLQWYVTGGHKTDSVSTAKLMQIPALLQGNNHFMIVTLQSDCAPTSCDTALTSVQQSALTLLEKDS
jgi:exosortase